MRCQLLHLISQQLGAALAVLFSASFAFLFVVVARAAILGLSNLGLQGPLQSFADALWPRPYSGTTLGAFGLAVAAAEATRLLLNTTRVNTWVISNFTSEMVKLLSRAMLEVRPVSISLDNRKVYVGFIQAIPSLDPSRGFVRILPVISGYRDDKTLTMVFTTDYTEMLSQASVVDDFVIVLPISSIKTLNFFDPTTHERFFGPRKIELA